MFWRRKKPKETAPPPNGYWLQWEAQRLPNPGTGNIAWTTYGLPQFSAIGPSVRARTPLNITTPQGYQLAFVPLAGIPRVAGTIVHAPLLNPGG